MNRKKVKNVYKARDISIKKGLIKTKIKKVNIPSHKSGIKSNDNSPAKRTIVGTTKKMGRFNGLEEDQPKEGDLSTMNVPKLSYDPNGDPLQFAKSPSRFRNDHFSPNQSRGWERNSNYNSSIRSPPGRNLGNSFNTINQSHGNMNSIDMSGYMVYPGGEIGNSIGDMKQYSGVPQYMVSMSTNINLGIIDDNSRMQKMQMRQQNNISLKKGIASRGNFRKGKRSKKPQGVKEYYMKRFQDSQTFSRINRDKVSDSLNKAGGLFSPEEPEPYEYKAIDSQVGSLMKRDYTVDRARMRNQNNLASLVVSSGKGDSAISPNPRRPLLNDSMMFKSTNSPAQMMGGTLYNQSIVGALSGRPGLASPGKDSRNIKLDPIDMCKFTNLSLIILATIKSSETKQDRNVSQPKNAKRHIFRQDTEMNNNLLDKDEDNMINIKKQILNKEETKTRELRPESLAKLNSQQVEKSPDSKSVKSTKKGSEVNRGSTNDDKSGTNETPNPLRDQTPSQLTYKNKSPSPDVEVVEEVKEEEKKPFKTKFPMSNSDMLEHLSKYLCKYEQKEVLKYPTVHFFNILERKLNGGAEEPKGTHNHGYDNEQGEYLYVDHDHIGYRFEIMRKLGKGSFGVVLK